MRNIMSIVALDPKSRRYTAVVKAGSPEGVTLAWTSPGTAPGARLRLLSSTGEVLATRDRDGARKAAKR